MKTRTITLEKIKYVSVDKNLNTDKPIITKREITSIFGLPFYLSSGNSSSASNTWFPFFGISIKEIKIDDGILPLGWFINYETVSSIPYSIQEDIKEACRFKSDNGKFATDLIDRLNTLPCLLISSVLGGGIWDRNSFKNLKNNLTRHKDYKDFYANFTGFEFSPNILNVNCKEKTIEKIKKVNEWLINHSMNNSIKTVTDLKENNLWTMKDLEQFKPNISLSLKHSK